VVLFAHARYGGTRHFGCNPYSILRAAIAKAATRYSSEKIKIHRTIWQLGKNNLSRLGACCPLSYMQQAPMTVKSFRSSLARRACNAARKIYTYKVDNIKIL
jgi:hypothetical protein